MLEVEGDKWLRMRALTGGVKAALEVKLDKVLKKRTGGLRFLVIR